MERGRRGKTIKPAGPVLILVLCIICLAYILATHVPILTSVIGLNSESPQHILRSSHPLRKPPDPLSCDQAVSYAEMMAEQKQRRALIDEVCSAANMSRTLDLGEDGENIFESVGHLLVDDKYKLLFGFIPKVGCTTWKGVISALGRTHRGDLSERKTLRGFKENLTEITYRVEKYRKVLFVREPITRMLSAYLSKLRNYKDLQKFWEKYIGREIVKSYRGNDHAKRFENVRDKPFMNITLSEFIQFITDVGDDIRMNELNDHWLPQHIISNPCKIQYDFIGHYENLATEAPFLLRWLGIDTVIRFPEVHASRATDSLVTEYSQVPLGLLKRLYDYYDFDYKVFGYRKNHTMSHLLREIFTDFDDE